MSKGNMLLGYARGKVGSMVFSRLNGEQITKSYNSSPRNDRTDAQMKQRSLFLATNKLFTRGQQNFFEFAFEDRGRSESDFNAFMRNNIKRGVMMSRKGFEEQSYPSIGPWLMTKGSLPSVNITPVANSNKYNIGSVARPGATSFGEFCQMLRSNFGVQNGDIITVCCISAIGTTSANTPAVDPRPRSFVEWVIKQGICDVDSQASLFNVFDGYIDTGQMQPNTTYMVDLKRSESLVGAACIVISRKTRRGLKVSTTQLVMNDEASTAYNTGQSALYQQEVLDSWQSKSEAILEGSEAKEVITAPEFTMFRGAASSIEGVKSIALSAVGEPLAQGTENPVRYVEVYCKHPENIVPSLFSGPEGVLDSISFTARLNVLSYGVLNPEYTGQIEISYDGEVIFTDPGTPEGE